MPEVCEVALTAHYLCSKLKGRNITNVEVLNGKYKKNGLGFEFDKPLKILDVNSKGKFMWFELSDKVWIMATFGLTGSWNLKSNYEKSDRIVFVIGDLEENLVFSDPLSMGTIDITRDSDKLYNKLNKLAPDFLKTDFSDRDFKKWVDEYKIKHGKTLLVKALTKQNVGEGIGSGIGNYLVAEILYRAKLSPHRTINSLLNKDITVLSKTIKKTLASCYLSAISKYTKHLGVVKNLTKYHEDYTDNKDDKNDEEPFEFYVYGLKKDKHGNNVTVENIVDNRKTYWVPSVQT